MIQWYLQNSAVIGGILAAIVALDHALAAIPSVESNSTFQLVSSIIAKLYSFVSGGGQQPPQPPQAGAQ